ncbi:MAG: glutathione S-transferase family protein [Devosia nanyangense]|nr:glutathione S-transferase family protein [Devosia nanyangense]
MLRILGRVTSINVRKVLWTADEIGLGYEREDWGLPIRDPAVPEFLALNPNAQVPVLIDEAFVLWESNVIMRYLAEKEASALWPTVLQERALVDQWLTWQATELNPPWGYAVNALIRKKPEYSDAERTAESIAKWSERMNLVEARLAQTGAYIAGETFSLADIALVLSIHRWFSTPFMHPHLPRVRDYFDRVKERKAAVPYLGETTP